MVESIKGIVFDYEDGTHGYYSDFCLSKKDEKKILKILNNYINDGSTLVGTLKEIAEEIRLESD